MADDVSHRFVLNFVLSLQAACIDFDAPLLLLFDLPVKNEVVR